MERAAAQAKRSRVNSVPANLGQQQQAQLMAQRHQQHRLSHGSYFAGGGGGPIPSRSRNRHHASSSSTSLLSASEDVLSAFDDNQSTQFNDMKQIGNEDYLDPIASGVDQLDISNSQNMLCNSVLPSKSLDSNAIKKTKTIFGNLSLFDGSPTYKQRRRRAASVSSSVLSPALTHPLHGGAGGPDRIRRHDKCHTRTTSTTASNNNNGINSHVQHLSIGSTFNSHSSRLAMAAVKAGFAPSQIISNASMPPISNSTMLPVASSSAQNWQQGTMDYLCPVPTCRRLFKRVDHLERHVNTFHAFVCSICGQQFPHSESLAQHRLEHEIKSEPLGADANYDDDSSPDDHSSNGHRGPSSGNSNGFGGVQQTRQGSNNTMMNQNGYYSPRNSFDSSRSSGWSAGISGSISSSHCSSRCSTLSPMLDIDFDMPDVQPQENPVPSCSSNSATTTESSCSVLPTPGFQEQPLLNTLYSGQDAVTRGRFNAVSRKHATWNVQSLNLEDDFSSSSASSPSSLSRYGNGSDDCQKMETTLSTPMTLLSPFKPEVYQQEELMNHESQSSLFMQQMGMNDFEHGNLFNEGLMDNTTLIPAQESDNNYMYAYPPYNDMNMVFSN